jgi:hypothetical protein
MRNLLTPLLLALSVAAGALAVTGCGGDGPETSAAAAARPSSPAEDCSSISTVANDLALADAVGWGMDYVAHRDFMAGYAERAPEEVADAAEHVRDLLDEFASIAADVGLEPGDSPLPDQIDAFREELDFSADEQAENARALQTLNTWVSNGCGS